MGRIVALVQCGVALAFLATGAAGCQREALPGTPEEAFEKTLALFTAGDVKGLYPYLTVETQSLLEAAHAALRETHELIQAYYPPEARASAVAAAGTAIAVDAATPAEMYAALVRQRPLVTLGTLASLGARVVAVREKPGGLVSVITAADDQVEFLRAPDGTWRWVLPATEATALQAFAQQATANLARARENVRKIRSFDGTGVVRALPPPVAPPPATDTNAKRGAVDAGPTDAVLAEPAPTGASDE